MSVTQVIPMLITSDWLAVRHSGSDQFSKQFNYQREQRPHRKLKLDVRREETAAREGREGRQSGPAWSGLTVDHVLTGEVQAPGLVLGDAL